MLKHLSYVLLITSLLIVGCQSEESTSLPTRVQIAVEPTTTPMPEATATATLFRPGPTLPPTFTQTPSPTPFVPPTHTPTPEGFDLNGTLYYIYNENTIIALSGDGSREEFLVNYGLDVPISDLAISPNEELLAFVGPGSGSAREIIVSSRDGTYTQPVTCLGFADVRLPTWSADGERIAFLAAPTVGAPLNIYSASWIGSNNCPEGNDQRLLLELNSSELSGLAYDPRGRRLLYSNGPIYVFDLETGVTFPPVTETGNLGPDFALKFSPVDDFLLAYLQDSVGAQDRYGGYLRGIIPRANDVLAPVEFDIRLLTLHFDWSRDGTRILTSSSSSVVVYTVRGGDTDVVLAAANLPPMAVFNPAGDRIAYIDSDPQINSLPQIYTVGLSGFNPTQITTHTEGTINDLHWLPGGF